MHDVLNTTLGDYATWFEDVLRQMTEVGMSVKGSRLSHIGLRTATNDEYVEFRDQLLPLCSGCVENVHNGRPIAKLLLRKPLQLPHGFEVSLIELMPPKPDKDYPTGIEHIGVVIGDDLDAFAEHHAAVLSGRQDQGPYCQPWFITFTDGKRVKFYTVGLKEVVELEGGVF